MTALPHSTLTASMKRPGPKTATAVATRAAKPRGETVGVREAGVDATADLDAQAAAWSTGVARGDAASLDGLYRAWFDRAFATARRFTGRDEAFCLDVVQETMLRAIKGLKPLNDRRALDAWMHAAVRSACLDALRSEARRVLRERQSSVKEHAERAAAEEFEGLLARMAELDAPSRELLRLRFEGTRTLAMTAAAAGISGGTAHGKLRRTLTWLRERMMETNA